MGGDYYLLCWFAEASVALIITAFPTEYFCHLLAAVQSCYDKTKDTYCEKNNITSIIIMTKEWT